MVILNINIQIHFAPEMWENKRQDNLMKLKRNAVPTLFGDTGNFYCSFI